MKEYLCDCSSCVSFNFDECEKVENETVDAKEMDIDNISG